MPQHRILPHHKLEAANSVNPHIQFTSEMPSEHGLPYLDTLVTVNQETKRFKTTLYVKPIASGYVMPVASHVPKGRKRATVRTEFFRAKQVSTDEGSYQNSRTIIWNKFIANGYPKYLIAQEERNSQQPRRRTPNRGKLIYLKIPFVDEVSEHEAKQVIRRSGLPVVPTFETAPPLNLLLR